MTPQSPFLVVASVAAGREAGLRALLAEMNSAPGVVDPDNPVLPFGRFERVHFARLMVLDQTTMADLSLYGVSPPDLGLRLVLLGDCDGPARTLLDELAAGAEDGLRRLFGHCEGFDPGTGLAAWLHAHSRPTQANYVNWLGRTVCQIHEESALQRFLSARVPRMPVASGEARRRRRELIEAARAEQRAGRLRLSAPQPAPLGWWLGNLAHALGVPLLALLVSPMLLLAAPWFVWRLRSLERSDPEHCPPPEAGHLRALRELEDRGLTNQFTAVGPVKPGAFRHALVPVLLLAIDWGARHIFHRGHLARVQTIHFARWVVLDGGARVLFCSNYDGIHEAYMDDFINKVAWGLNLIFSNGVGWPRTDWLVARGARREGCFKKYQRAHQVPSQVWYDAYPGVTLNDMRRNRRIREGLEQGEMGEDQALAWLRLL
ncbi:MAG: hypothetical protein PHR30_02820 [Gallionellaceae bacterium]|nr:hypothetical protein [Gallionellaceae bacterium]